MMTTKEARALKAGDRVWAKNGKYEQNATVVDTQPHHSSGLWITYTWSKNGRIRTATKRHLRVHLAATSWWLVKGHRFNEWTPRELTDEEAIFAGSTFNVRGPFNSKEEAMAAI
jgi:hypothetical protein